MTAMLTAWLNHELSLCKATNSEQPFCREIQPPYGEAVLILRAQFINAVQSTGITEGTMIEAC